MRELKGTVPQYTLLLDGRHVTLKKNKQTNKNTNTQPNKQKQTEKREETGNRKLRTPVSNFAIEAAFTHQ